MTNFDKIVVGSSSFSPVPVENNNYKNKKQKYYETLPSSLLAQIATDHPSSYSNMLAVCKCWNKDLTNSMMQPLPFFRKANRFYVIPEVPIKSFTLSSDDQRELNPAILFGRNAPFRKTGKVFYRIVTGEGPVKVHVLESKKPLTFQLSYEMFDIFSSQQANLVIYHRTTGKLLQTIKIKQEGDRKTAFAENEAGAAQQEIAPIVSCFQRGEKGFISVQSDGTILDHVMDHTQKTPCVVSNVIKKSSKGMSIFTACLVSDYIVSLNRKGVTNSIEGFSLIDSSSFTLHNDTSAVKLFPGDKKFFSVSERSIRCFKENNARKLREYVSFAQPMGNDSFVPGMCRMSIDEKLILISIKKEDELLPSQFGFISLANAKVSYKFKGPLPTSSLWLLNNFAVNVMRDHEPLSREMSDPGPKTYVSFVYQSDVYEPEGTFFNRTREFLGQPLVIVDESFPFPILIRISGKNLHMSQLVDSSPKKRQTGSKCIVQ